MATSIPHMAFPFKIGRNGHAAELEQDTDDEIVNCVMLICTVTQGGLMDEPEFGITDPTFQLRPNVNLISAQVRDWESRVTVVTIANPDKDLTLENLTVQVQTGGGQR